MKRQGFTLIELVMVIVIIGILAAIAIPRFVSLRGDAMRAACEANAGALRAAISNYYANASLRNITPEWPADLGNATFLTTYMQSTPDAPILNTTWQNSYSNTTGILNMTAACGSL